VTRREREILNGIRGLLDHALLLLPPDEPADEEHARGWVTTAVAEAGKLLDGAR
jgi:hypothetical protein